MSTTAASPRASNLLMIATYVVCVAGLFIGYSTVSASPPSLTWATLLTVVGGGLLSFVRHSITHRSDAARLGWDYGRVNAFQIEVGVANLAWGLAGLLAVVLGWGIVAQGMTFVVFGIYMVGAAVVQVVLKRGVKMSLVSAVFGVALLWLGILGVSAG